MYNLVAIDPPCVRGSGMDAPSGPILTFASAIGQVVRKCQNLLDH